MGKQEHADGWACFDCIMLIANGETPIDWTEDQTNEWLERIGDHGLLTMGRMIGGDGCVCDGEDIACHEDVCEQIEFSWSRCDVCQSTLGGSRDAVTFWFDSEVEPTPTAKALFSKMGV